MKKILLLLFVFLNLTMSATNYYISPNGNDNNIGTSITTAWKTLNKVNSFTNFKAGDQILFERGGTYRGTLNISKSGTSTAPLVVTAYGTGNNPLFLGSQTKTWTTHTSNIWKTSISATSEGKVQNLYQNGQLLTLARWPNVGWLRNDNGSTTTINDSELTQSGNYWTGATAVIRSSGWSYHNTTVTSYTTGKLTFNSIGGYNLSDRQWGYFLCNKLSELDSPGEWYWDGSTLYLWPLNNSNPNTSNIEIATSFYGVRIKSNVQFINVSNIDLKYYTDLAIYISGHNNKIQNCYVSQSYKGSKIVGNSNTLSSNNFSNIYATAIHISPGNNNIIESNSFTNCGVIPGLGETGGWGYFGVRVSGTGNIVRKNNVFKTGYTAIEVDGNTLVENNRIENACYILNDGAAIAFDNADGVIIRNNIIFSTIGNVESCAPNYTGCELKGKGIYFGNHIIRNSIVQENTVAYCNGAGIWVDHTMSSTGNKILNNTLFNNQLYQLGLSDYSNNVGTGAVSPYAVASYNEVYSGNILYSMNNTQKSMYQINKWYSGVNFGTFSNNYYYNFWNSSPITVERFIAPNQGLFNYNLTQWIALSKETGSKQSNYLPTSLASNHILLYNDTYSPQTISISGGVWSDVYGNIFTGNVTLDSFKSKIIYKVSESPVCVFTYSNWSSCSNGFQTRSYTSSPLGCLGVPSQDSLSRSCTIPSCVFTYSNWSGCVNGTQTRTYTSVPNGCVGIPPIDSLSKTCIIVPPPSSGIDLNDVIILVNTNETNSLSLANQYASIWGIPTSNIIQVSLGTSEDLASSATLNTARNSINKGQYIILACSIPS